MEPAQAIAYLIAFVAVVGFLFLIGRAIVCWYLRLTEIVVVLEEIRDALKPAAKAVVVAAAVMSILGAVDSHADDSWRCRGKVVYVGDDQSTVLAKCGEPTSRAYAGDSTSWRTHRVGRTAYGSAHTVPIERWTYRVRKGSFPRILTFRGGLLWDISYGDK